MRAVLVILFLALTAAAPLDPYAPYTSPQRLVRLPDGRRINLYCLGKGSPTVVLDAGWAGGLFSWSGVQGELAKTHKTCALDRAGMGFSDPGPEPRDARAAASDLDATLRAAKIPGPYVLVGHSLGGLNVRLFAARHRNRVAGLVLVDPVSEHQDARMAAAAPRTAGQGQAMVAKLRACFDAAKAGRLTAGTPVDDRCVGTVRTSLPEAFRTVILAQRRNPGYRRALLSEYENIAGADSRQFEGADRNLGSLPLIVLTAGDMGQDPQATAEESAEITAIWRRMHAETAALSTRGRHRIIPGAGHNIQSDRPEAVIVAVSDVIAMARKP